MSGTEEEIKRRMDEETAALIAMSPEDRFKYVQGVLNSIVDGLKGVVNEKGRIKQAKAADAFFIELNKKAPVLLPPILHSIKREYKDVYIVLLQELSGVMEKG